MAGHYSFNAFYQLHRLFDSPITRKEIPKQLLKFFTSSTELPSNFKNSFLIGDVDDYYHHVINLQIKIAKEFYAPVILYNIYYQNHDLRQDIELINLTSREAFLIFANILANDRSYYYFSDTPFEDTDVNSVFHKYHFLSYGDDYSRLVHFGHNYLLYLKNALLSSSLSPYEIAFHRGIRLLCFLSHLKPVQDFAYLILEEINNHNVLTLNQKIIYHCF